jgi:predicted ferric reductase/Ca2+-binding EF-hand superfamily protein
MIAPRGEALARATSTVPTQSGSPPRRTSGFRWSSPDGEPGRHSSLVELEPGAALLDPAILELLERCFAKLCGTDSNIDRGDLKHALELKCDYLAERILCVLDEDGDGLIDREDFLGSIRTLLFGSARERLSFAFRIHDLDGDAVLSRAELEHMIGLGLREDALEAPEREAARLTDLLLAAADKDGGQTLCFAEFEAAIRMHHTVFNQVTRSGLVWLAPDEGIRDEVASIAARVPEPTFRERLSRRVAILGHRLENRALPYALFAAWGLANIVLFARAGSTYAAAGAPLAVQVARGAGACLKLNAALILLPSLRLLLTWVRRIPRLQFLPVDEALGFHRLLGTTILAFGAVHTGAHLWNKSPAFAQNPLRVIASMKAGPTGLALLVGLTLLWLFALPRVRAWNFEAFHYSHLFYLAFFPLLFMHGPKFVAWGALPCALFVVDRGLRMLRRTHRSQVLSATALRSQVTRLELARPPGFEHHATDYVFIRIPEISRHEWHPFTISSAPQRERLGLHIRALGNWTRELHALIASGRADTQPAIEVEVDGPYGAPCAHIFSSKKVVLIGAGIGATPFASVLESIALAGQEGRQLGQLEKVHFFWVNRDQKGFEWFRVLLASIERTDQGRLLDIRTHMTGGRNDAASSLLSLARELSRAQGQCDLVTGLRAGTRMGHPDFARELGRIALLHAPDPVAVYFCGPPGLARKVRTVCAKLGMDFRQEHF